MCMAVRSSGRGTTAGFFVESSTSGAASSEASLSALGSPGRGEEGGGEGEEEGRVLQAAWVELLGVQVCLGWNER